MNKKIILLILMIVLAGAVYGSMSSSSINWLSKGQADSLYCQAADGCTSSSSGNSSSPWNRTGTNTYLTNSDDNVGIGTISPSNNLEVIGTEKVQGTLYLNHSGYPVLSITRDTGATGSNVYSAALLKRYTTSPADGGGIAFYFSYPNSAGVDKFTGMFGAVMSTVNKDNTVGDVIFTAAYNGTDPYSYTHMRLRATSVSTADFYVYGREILGAGFDSVIPTAPLVLFDSASNISRLKIFSNTANLNDLAGLGFGVHTNPGGLKYIKSAIAHNRIGSWGVGDLVFYVDSTADAADVLPTDEKMRLSSSGNLTVNIGNITTNKYIGLEMQLNMTRVTRDGCTVIQMLNNYTTALERGNLVEISQTKNASVINTSISSDMPIGAVYETCAGNSWCWVGQSGLCPVKIYSGNAVGYIAYSSASVFGMADASPTLPDVATHNREIGHIYRTFPGSNVAIVNMHFN